MTILGLEQLADNALFKVLSEGIPLIVENAVNLDETARRLYLDKEYRASEIMRGIAMEEAAKVLVLIDYVRCPRNSMGRRQVLSRFKDHVAKRIHAMACRYPNIASFGELSKLVENECRPWYLDGPNGVDWIFPNAISEKRDHDLYVDYVLDITNPAGVSYWNVPATPIPIFRQYAASDCVRLAKNLSEAGVSTVKGLSEIADVWRGFTPVPETDREELRTLIVETLDRLERCYGAVEEVAAKFIVSHWPFPMWPLTIKVPGSANETLDGLREERERTGP